MQKKSCRLCGYDLFNKPLLTLNGMPKAAQHFLSKNDITNDKGIDLDIFQCSSCGLVQLTIEPVDYYKEVITAASISGDARKSRLNQMLEFANKYDLKGKKIIEIGCAKGNMLDIIEEAKMKAYGLEYSSESIKIAKNANRANNRFRHINNIFYKGIVSSLQSIFCIGPRCISLTKIGSSSKSSALASNNRIRI